MARKQIPPTAVPDPWPKEMAIRRLKEAYEGISELEGLNHEDPKFEAWKENVRRIFQHNWPGEHLPNFWSMVISMRGGPGITRADIEAYRTGLQRAKVQIENILRNERELAEAQNDVPVMEVFIRPGAQHDAYREIRAIISEATTDLVIVDNYVDGSLFPLLTNAVPAVAIRILTFNTPVDFALEARKFVNQHERTVEIRKRNEFHDRFIIVDGNKVYHLGHSIKDAGTKAMMIQELEDAGNVAGVVTTYQNAWNTAALFPI